MNHKNGFNPLSRTTAHRRAMSRNMVTSLFRYERITTTKAKALEQLEELHKQIDLLNYKENFYRNLIKNNLKDAWNPMNSMQSKDVAV